MGASRISCSKVFGVGQRMGDVSPEAHVCVRRTHGVPRGWASSPEIAQPLQNLQFPLHQGSKKLSKWGSSFNPCKPSSSQLFCKGSSESFSCSTLLPSEYNTFGNILIFANINSMKSQKKLHPQFYWWLCILGQPSFSNGEDLYKFSQVNVVTSLNTYQIIPHFSWAATQTVWLNHQCGWIYV